MLFGAQDAFTVPFPDIVYPLAQDVVYVQELLFPLIVQVSPGCPAFTQF
jgi:hypothetical protein